MGTAAVHDRVPAAARRRWPKWAEAKKGTRQVLADCWQVVRVPSFLVLLVEHITDLTSGAGGFAVQYNQVSKSACEPVMGRCICDVRVGTILRLKDRGLHRTSCDDGGRARTARGELF